MPSDQASLALVTGTTSGIGTAVASELLERGWRVVGVGRRVASISHQRYTHLCLDLRDVDRVAATLDTELTPLIADGAITRLGLVNNAAMEAILGPIRQLNVSSMLEVYAVNTAAPTLLMGWFQRHARQGQPLRIVNVSTGAAVTPLPGLGAYGSSKAALRLIGMILAAEQSADGSGAAGGPDTSVLSYDPGLVDTPMQRAVRESSAELLPIVHVFKEFAATGALVSPALPAKAIADYLCTDGHEPWEEHSLGSPATGELSNRGDS